MTLLSVRGLGKRFGSHHAAQDVSFDLAAGEILALIGPSGCGKTTTLRMIAGFETPDAGQVLLNGRAITDLAPERRGIGMVFQDFALFPHMTVLDNVRFGTRDGQLATARDMLGLVGLDGLGGRFPDQMSGGQQQRAALARSFAAGPSLILLDEPFSNLDPILRSATRREIRRLLKSTGLGIVMVTHDQEEALSFADRIAVMSGGRILQCAAAREIYNLPHDRFVAGFLGRTNLIDGVADGAFCATALGRLALARPATGHVTLSLRPESIQLRPSDAADAGRITAVEFKGHDVTYWADWRGIELQVDALAGPHLNEGAGVIPHVIGRAVPLARTDTTPSDA
ncbi:ABC transporter ATP-binding protein [Paracoccus laeviglucosivorans]|uniref:Iron(III) transport system ATP-binding protein n=1 Tax=Paracoccus laeviglucosivorans TaxID=1197861 RepID=A0A521CYT0_9RHOB|nr:ABC transporter ATP-binding protein [Paracoccus laeviglucosivorans]SMO64589.1 iron(III) transport system ATP-binding protein [Paracoccus laeviglucosivorans]